MTSTSYDKVQRREFWAFLSTLFSLWASSSLHLIPTITATAATSHEKIHAPFASFIPHSLTLSNQALFQETSRKNVLQQIYYSSYAVQHCPFQRYSFAIFSSAASSRSNSISSTTAAATVPLYPDKLTSNTRNSTKKLVTIHDYLTNSNSNKKVDQQLIEKELLYLSRTGRINDALSLYWSVWEHDNDYTITSTRATSSDTKEDTERKEKASLIVKPNTKLMNHAIDACARHRPSPLVSEAFEIFEHGIVGGKSGIRRLSPNVFTFGALMSVCAKVGDVKKCKQLLLTMKDQYGITPNPVVFSTAITACERSCPPQPKVAMELLKQATHPNHGKDTIDGSMSVIGYNAALSVLARVADWKMATQLLREMEIRSPYGNLYEQINTSDNATNTSTHVIILHSDIITPVPDKVTYGTVMAACERAGEWTQVLKLAARQQSIHLALQEKHDSLNMDGMAFTSVLHACQQLGLAEEALYYLNQMKQLGKNNVVTSEKDAVSTWTDSGRRKPLKGPDSVAYHLAISACARSGISSINYSNTNNFSAFSSLEGTNTKNCVRWIDGIRLLREMEEVTGSPPDVIAFTAAIVGCAEAGEWKRAFALFNEMQSVYNVQPNVVTYTAVISACANALAKGRENQELFGSSANQQLNRSCDSDDPLKAALLLLAKMKNSSLDDQPNIVTYNAAIRSCAEGHDLSKSFELMTELLGRKLVPTVVTFGSLMTACERVGDVQGVSSVFRLLNQYNLERKDNPLIVPNEIIYGAAISCCRKAGQADRTVLLLKKMIKDGLKPNTATFNTVIVALTEGNEPNIDKAISVFHVMGSQFCDSRPNRQTFTMIIRSLASNRRPKDAEEFLNKMMSAGFTPDVDLFTATVSAYEKCREPLRALQLMEYMRQHGYDFYDIQVLNDAFKKAIKLVNVVGRGLSSTSRMTSAAANSTDCITFIMDSDDISTP